MHINWAHIHLMINHFPVIGILGAQVLLVYGLIRRKHDFTVFSFGVFIVLALITVAVFFTGHGAEDVVKKLPGVTEAFIERHEESAEFTLILMGILGVSGIVGLFFERKSGSIPAWILMIVLLIALAATIMVGVTANLGGQIRHTEIR
jgi:uncharacterized membrane protein